MKLFKFEKTDISKVFDIVKEHASTLSSPWDSFMEENLLKNDACLISADGVVVGYASLNNDTLFSFYVVKSYYRFAPDILFDFVKKFNIAVVQALTNDSLFMGLLMEWDCVVKDRGGCFFSDNGRLPKPSIMADNPRFREAEASDIANIILRTQDFFEKHEMRIAEKTLFVLEDGDELMGCGLVEVGKIHTDCVSIGMITCKGHRQKGVAKMILWHLKEWAYQHSLRPIAGCWYYNVLSRRCLESSGMVPTGKAYTVILTDKKTLPLRTGNPPGELV